MISKAVDFAHLHVHTHYSLLDGACRLDELVDCAVKDEQPAIAITDHGNLFGAISFYRLCKKNGVKPILGIESYLAQKSRLEKANSLNNQTYHITLLAENDKGWSNIIKLSSIAFREGFYRRPRVDKEVMSKHSEGIICLTGCLGGEVNQHILRDDPAGALKAAGEMRDIFGESNVYLEVMDNGYEGQKKSLDGLGLISRDLGLPLVATNDVHYTKAGDAKAQDILLCINTGKTVLDENRFRMEGQQLYFKTRAEMAAIFKALPQALANTVQIAERCNVEIDFDTYHLPIFTPPTAERVNAYFDRLCEEGASKNYGQITEKIRTRLEYEKSIIKKLGFVSYFLITCDFINYARKNNIPVGPGRGSAVGSIVSYCLGITELDPLKYDLIFERFLNTERISMPDIDVDFCRDKRDQVIDYVKQKYGEENVCQIITFGTMASRGVIRDVGRALDIPLGEVDKIAKKIPQGPGASLAEALETDEELKAIRSAGRDKQELFEIGLKLEGLSRHVSTHAAGVVIADRPLEEYVPIYKNGDDITTQWQMNDLEAVGLLKVDFLGLKTLTILAEALRLIELDHGVKIDLQTVPLDDRKTFELLMHGDTLGVFQLESRGMRDLMRRLKPDNFEDIIALIALYRPGPLKSGMADTYVRRKHGQEKVSYPLKVLEPVLESSYGVILYQEQVMLIANKMAGFSMNEADSLRKAMGKKKPEVMAEFREKFVDGSMRNGHHKKKADEIFTTMEYFAGYGFNKSHSAAYAVLTYRTSYLKANYPVEFMCALLSCDLGLTDKVKELVDEARSIGIEVLGPNINKSASRFSVKDGKIRYGLAAMKGMGEKAATALVLEREKNGPYLDLPDLAVRWDPQLANKTCYEVLSKGGGFDTTGWTRRACFESYAEHLKEAQHVHADRKRGQSLLFMAAADSGKGLNESAIPDIPEWRGGLFLANEKEALGFYLSGHPFEKRGAFYSRLAGTNISELAALRDAASGETIWLSGMLSGIRRLVVKSGQNAGQRMARFQIEDLHGSISATVFTKQYQLIKDKLIDDALVFAQARFDKNSDEVALLVDDVVPADEYVRNNVDAVVLRIDESRHGLAIVDTLMEMALANRGRHRLIFEIRTNEGKTIKMLADPEFKIDLSDQMLDGLAELLGAANLSFTKN